MSPASSKLRQKTKQALRKKPYMRCYHLPKPYTRRLLPNSLAGAQTEAKDLKSKNHTITGTPDCVKHSSHSQRGLPPRFLWLTPEGIKLDSGHNADETTQKHTIQGRRLCQTRQIVSKTTRLATTIPMAHPRGDRSWRLATTSTRRAAA